MRVSIIVACSRDGLIGIDGKLPWHLPEDLKRFKEITDGCPLVMGRKTWDSLPVKPLNGRINCILSRNLLDQVPTGAVRASSLQVAIDWFRMADYEELFVIGGEEVYREAMNKADRVYLTFVDRSIKIVDDVPLAYFPLNELDSRWTMSSNDIRADFSFQIYERVR